MTSAMALDRVPRERVMAPRTLLWLVRRELRDAVRNRWLIIYAATFALLSIAMASVAQFGTGYSGLAGFGKTAASLVNIVLLIVPLMGVTLGVSHLPAERESGSLAYLLAQPVSRLEVYVAKFLGLALAFVGSIAIGFGVTGAYLAMRSAGGDSRVFIQVAGMGMLLATSTLAIGMVVGVVVRRATAALGAGVFVWLVMVVLGDLGLMGSAVLLRMRAGELLAAATLNPTQVFRVGALQSLNATLDVLGPVGLFASRTLGDWLMPTMVGLLLAWTLIPLGLGAWLFARRPL